MTFRSFIKRLAENGKLITITEPISTESEMSGVLKEFEPRAVLFEEIHESEFRSSRQYFSHQGGFC